MKYKFILITSYLLMANSAFSCDKEIYSAKEAFKNSDHVFSGQVTNLRYLDDVNQTKLEPRIIVTFNIESHWKGKKEKQFIIHTTHNKGSCNGFVFKLGEKYLVYAVTQKRADHFLVNLFTKKEPTIGIKFYGGTKKLSDAGIDLLFLKEKTKI